MIIEFSIKNYKSFKEETKFSMVATEEERSSNRICELPYNFKVLPIASIYGGNASGKSNFVLALKALQTIVLNGVTPQIADPFLLDDKYLKEPSTFDIKILVKDTIYRYTVSVTQAEIVKERLAIINPDDMEDELYIKKKRDISLGEKNLKGSKQLDILKLLIKSKIFTAKQTFLENTAAFNFEHFTPIWNWFLKLRIENSNTNFELPPVYYEDGTPENEGINEILQEIDIGISRIGSIEVPTNLPLELIKVLSSIPENQPTKLNPQDNLVFIRKGEKIISKRSGFFHKKADGKEVPFDRTRESDGSLKMVNILLPLFMKILAPKSDRLLIFDEFDRSLHSELTNALIERYLSRCSKDTRTQLIITTHDVQLLNSNILRRDEVWFTERKPDGCSDMFSLCSFKDNEEDMRDYLQGKFGGIPNVMHFVA
ncbi:MAG: ATP-binding protein [Holosporales bacterium]|jgi:AAA15 family ATPase/GTPase|nr:ATP-binding protein [Holosporales bacterium]